MLLNYKLSQSFLDKSGIYNKFEFNKLTDEIFNLHSNTFFEINVDDQENFENVCEKFLYFWFDSDFQNLQKQICLIQNCLIYNNKHDNDIIEKTLDDKEIVVSLLELISYDEASSGLLDYIEESQDIFVKAFTLLYTIAKYSIKIGKELIVNYGLLDIIEHNFKDYSVNSKIASIMLLKEVAEIDSFLFEFLKHFKLLKAFAKTIVTTDSKELKALLLYLFIKILQGNIASSDQVKQVLLGSFLQSLNIDDSNIISLSICGVFYFFYNNIDYLQNECVEHILEIGFNHLDPSISYYIIQILKLCYMEFDDTRLCSLQNKIDFNFIHQCLDYNDPFQYSITLLIFTIVNRGPPFFQFLFDNNIFQHLYCLYDKAKFEIKSMILLDFSLCVIKSNSLQRQTLFDSNYDVFLIQNIPDFEIKEAYLDALIIIVDFSFDKIEIETTIQNLSTIETETDEEKNKLQYLLSLLESKSGNSNLS